MQKTIEDYEKLVQELKEEIHQMKRNKKYGLVWEEQLEKNIEDGQSIPLLVEDISKKIITSEEQPVNLIIEGDNYDSLKSLLYTHKEQIDVIYIDPPYNTGNKDFRYNDSYVDHDDNWKHSKWLSFMNKRLKLAKELLSPKGILFVSIDQNEFSQLKQLMDLVFGEHNFIETFIWQKKKGGGNDSVFSATEHEYIFCYSKAKKVTPRFLCKYEEDYLKRYSEEDEKSRYYWDTFKRKSGKQYYPIICPDGSVLETDDYGNKISWLRSESRFLKDLEEGDVKISKTDKGWSVYFKQRLPLGKKPRSLILDKGTTSEGSKEIFDIFKENIFDNPKPTTLIKHLINITMDKDAIILDFFAGSGTTGHAVLELNKDDGGNRQFILCTNNENNICEEVTYERNKKVIQGYTNSKGKEIQGLGGNLKYYKVEKVPTDKPFNDKEIISIRDMSTELFLIKENTYFKEIEEDGFTIYGNRKDKITGILYDYSKYEEFTEALLDYNVEKTLYMFTWTNSVYENLVEEISSQLQQVSFEPIPENILSFYRNNKEVF